MNPVAAESLVREFAEQGGEELTLTGGEPLLYPAIQALAETADSLGLATSVFTMGLVSDAREAPDEMIEHLLPLVRNWRFSLHGATAQEHEEVTGVNGSFSGTIAVISRLIQADAAVDATFVVRPNALSQLHSVAQLCGDLGVHELRVVAVVEQGRQIGPPPRLTKDLLRAVDLADELSQTSVRLGNAALAQLGLENECCAPEEELVVSVDGWVSACHVVEPYPSKDDDDNVFRLGLAETVRRSPRLAHLRKISAESGWRCSDGCLMERSVRAPAHELAPNAVLATTRA